MAALPNWRDTMNFYFKEQKAIFLNARPALTEAQKKAALRTLYLRDMWASLNQAERDAARLRAANAAAANAPPVINTGGLHPTAAEIALENAAAANAHITQPELIDLNRTIETRPQRKFHDRELERQTRALRFWDNFATPSRRRWWRVWRTHRRGITRDVTRGLKQREKALTNAQRALWENEASRLDTRRRRLGGIWNIPLPDPTAPLFNHLSTHVQQLGPGEQWVARRVLGKGGQGCATQLIVIDNAENIRFNLAVKSSINPINLPAAAPSAMNKTLGPGIPNECWWTKEAYSTAPDYVPIAWDEHWAQGQRFYLPMEYMPFGSLQELIWRHLNPPNGSGRTPIPEPFIWLLLDRLSQAGTQFSVAEWFPRAVDPLVSQRPLLHLDIKPDNILLGNYRTSNATGTADFPAYEYPYLSDFGCARPDRNIPKVVDSPNLPGTLGYRAPEHMGDDTQAYTQQSDLYIMGITAWCLMELNMAPPLLRHEVQNNSTVPQTHVFTIPSPYSIQLQNFVTNMMTRNILNRPDFTMMQLMAWSSLNNLNMLQSRWPTAAVPNHTQIFFGDDHYPTGQTVPAREDW
ncbi:kinase-like protein [Rhizodiscina lignyota]|uniref:non-specific serine/threonine protein kinase n=1 Tax=Rhizodiscina lignyota TaxID=1504668 RepID=A0A9P4I5V8_9PEZI|nr:kinase-like protein [Rhizodiscina lignyota]